MKLRLFLTFPVLLLLTCSSFSQEYSYTHYDVKDGLAGSNVFCITQDKQGFIWMGTEGGLSRFDGTHFKNFTLEDGLPDIEVLQLFTDSRGRIWMRPFSKSVCFYYDGRIHNQLNDPLLRQIRIRGEIEDFAEDKDGNILLQEKNVLHLFTSSGEVRDIDTIKGQPIACVAIGTGPDGHFLVREQHDMYNFSGKDFSRFIVFNTSDHYGPVPYTNISPGLMTWRISKFKCRLRSLRTDKFTDIYQEWALKHISYSLIGDSLVYRNESMGAREYNVFTGMVRYFPLGGEISRTFRDNEGNLWFTSLGQGVFRLNSDEIRSIQLITKNHAHCAALTINRTGNELLVGATAGMLFRFALPAFRDLGSSQVVPSQVHDLRYVSKLKDGHLLIGSTAFVILSPHPEPNKKYALFSVKTAVLKNDSELLVGGQAGVRVIDIRNLRIKDSLWPERATVVYYSNNITYVGTLNGLYSIKPDRSFEYWGTRDPILQKRISAVVQAVDGTLWIATYGGGIIGWKDGRRVAVFSRRQGLSSDLCRTMELHGNTLWIGTDKGLNKVSLDDPEYPVTSYTANDGLGSDIINTILIDSAMVYLGTPAGLSFFDATRANRSAGCNLVLLGVINSGKDRLPDTADLHLPYHHSDVRFEFAGISYRSSGNISYYYRLLGLDSNWKRTNESFLEYPTLPSGDYELQLRAINKFGVRTLPLSVRFAVTTPFWRTGWFNAAVLLVFLTLAWLFISLRIRHLRRRQAKEEGLYRRMAETEHMALQAQMNPHFIFNCLNSIQQYIFDQDLFVANKYISGFAKLIRATLNNSTKPFISLKDELNYLSAYLSLEKLRFKDKMTYSIDVEVGMQNEMDDILIPSMLLQPYVENSMRHGLRHKTEGQGIIHIRVRSEGDTLVVVVEDNGIGRAQAARYKTREHIEYQSRGMALTADRIRLINTVSGGSIRVEVFDLKDQHGEAAGTRVVARFPRYDLLQ